MVFLRRTHPSVSVACADVRGSIPGVASADVKRRKIFVAAMAPEKQRRCPTTLRPAIGCRRIPVHRRRSTEFNHDRTGRPRQPSQPAARQGAERFHPRGHAQGDPRSAASSGCRFTTPASTASCASSSCRSPTSPRPNGSSPRASGSTARRSSPGWSTPPRRISMSCRATGRRFFSPFDSSSLNFICRFLDRDGQPAAFTPDNILGHRPRALPGSAPGSSSTPSASSSSFSFARAVRRTSPPTARSAITRRRRSSRAATSSTRWSATSPRSPARSSTPTPRSATSTRCARICRCSPAGAPSSTRSSS